MSIGGLYEPPESPTQNRLLPSSSGRSGAICFFLKDVSLQRWRMSLRRCLHWDWFGKTLDDSTCSFFALPKLPYPYWSCHTRCLKAKTCWSKTFLKLLLQRLLPLREFFPCGRRKLMPLATKKNGLNPTPATRHGLQGTCSKDNTSQDQNRKCLTHKPYIYNDSLDGLAYIFYLWISTGNVCSTTDLFLSQSVGHAAASGQLWCTAAVVL